MIVEGHSEIVVDVCRSSVCIYVDWDNPYQFGGETSTRGRGSRQSEGTGGTACTTYDWIHTTLQSDETL